MWKVVPVPGITLSLGDKTEHEKLPYLSHKRLLFTLVQCYIYSDNNSLAIVTSEWAQAKITNKNPQTIHRIPKPMQKTNTKSNLPLNMMMINRKGSSTRPNVKTVTKNLNFIIAPTLEAATNPV